MNTQEDILFSFGIVPVMVIHREADAVLLSKALMDAGLPIAEVTFRTPAAEASLKRICRELPDMLAGAGTITSVEQAKRALDAGAAFLVTPGYNPDVVRWCVDKNVPIYPGCTTASEVEAAMNQGLGIVKFFPAEQSGGLAKIKALGGPYPSMRFMPTGGVNLANMAQYLAYPKIFACGGSFMVPGDLVDKGAWEGITTLCRQAVCAAQGFSLHHVTLYAPDPAKAEDLARQFACLTGQDLHLRQNAFFVGEELETRSHTGSRKGRIVYSVLNPERTRRYLEQKGFAMDPASLLRDAGDHLVCMDLAETIGGYDVRLVARS